MDVRAVHGRMTAGGPASALAQPRGMRRIANENLPGLPLHLGMAFKAKIRVVLDQQLAIDRSMGVVTDRAAFAQGFMLEDKGPRLLAMALPTALIQA